MTTSAVTDRREIKWDLYDFCRRRSDCAISPRARPGVLFIGADIGALAEAGLIKPV